MFTAGTAARLRIQAEPPAPAPWRHLPWLQRLRCGWLGRADRESGPRGLEIRDLAGHELLCLPDARAPVEITLSPGTYEVRVSSGGSQRSYTVLLEAGAVFDLRVGRIAGPE